MPFQSSIIIVVVLVLPPSAFKVLGVPGGGHLPARRFRSEGGGSSSSFLHPAGWSRWTAGDVDGRASQE